MYDFSSISIWRNVYKLFIEVGGKVMKEKIEKIPEICAELLTIYNEIKREAHKECTNSYSENEVAGVIRKKV